MIAAEMDQAAVLVQMLERVDERRLPAGKQRDGEDDPCETGSQFSSLGQRR